MSKLLKILQSLFDEKIIDSLWCGTDGQVWARKLNYADACPTMGYYDTANKAWRERIQPLGQFSPWQVKLAAWCCAGPGVLWRKLRKDHDGISGWSLCAVLV